jgi:hypothetical protein
VVLRPRDGGAVRPASPADRVAAPALPGDPGRLRWVHPLAGTRQMPGHDGRRFGAARDGLRPAECGSGHCGVDLGSRRGSVVHAAADGVVAAVVPEIRERAGRFVIIDHAAGLRTFYMHLDDLRLDLEVGQEIRGGEPIGTLGRTGVVRSGAHLHFALAQERAGRSVYLDPEPILQHAVVLADEAPLLHDGDRLGGPLRVARPRGTPLGPLLAARSSALRITTDAAGRFRLDGVAPGSYLAGALHAELAPGWSAPFAVRGDGEVADVAIQLAAGVIVRGEVRGPRGPIAGARVIAEAGSGESVHPVGRAFSDGAGRFALGPLAGPVTVRVTATRHGAVERQLILHAGGATPGRREERFELASEDAELRGQVVDDDGFPVRGARLLVIDGPSRGRRAVSDAGGSFVLDGLAAGRYQLEVRAAGFPPARASAVTGDRASIALAVGATLRVAVRDHHTGAALAGVRLEAGGPDGGRASGVADERGVVTLPALAAGSWRLRAAHPGYARAEQRIVVAATRGGGAEATLELSRGAAIAGVVRDASGERVAGARVAIGGAVTTTDLHGRFRLGAAPTGAVELVAEHGEARGSQRLVLAPGDERLTVELRLD